MRHISIQFFVYLLFITIGVPYSLAAVPPEEELQYSLKKVYYEDDKRKLDYDFSLGEQKPITGLPGVDQIIIDPNNPDFITGIDPLNFVFNVNANHFILDTGSKSLILKGTSIPAPDCGSGLNCYPSGALEHTDGGDKLARSEKKFFNAVRLRDFKSFSSDKYNAFIYGFQSNNVPGTESYPQARITAKWIKGYYSGEYFEGDLVLESQIYTNNGILWEFAVTGGGGQVVPGTSDPSIVVIDLAIESIEDGQKVIFYYRSNSASNDPLTKESAGWIQYATYTTSGTAFHGYPINKGLLSLVASDLSYPPDAPVDNPINDGKNVEVTNSVSENITKESILQDYHVVDFIPVSNKKIIVYNCTPGSLTTIRSKFSGMSRKPSELSVAKLKNNNRSLPYRNYRTSFTGVESGDWAITASDGTTFIEPDQTLTPGAEYFFYLFIQDNDLIYDLDPTPGVIEDPVVIGIGSQKSSLLFKALPAIINGAGK